jgi:hypothetical protein
MRRNHANGPLVRRGTQGKLLRRKWCNSRNEVLLVDIPALVEGSQRKMVFGHERFLLFSAFRLVYHEKR